MAEERADRKVELLMQSVKKTRKRRRVKEEDEEEDMSKVVVSTYASIAFKKIQKRQYSLILVLIRKYSECRCKILMLV